MMASSASSSRPSISPGRLLNRFSFFSSADLSSAGAWWKEPRWWWIVCVLSFKLHFLFISFQWHLQFANEYNILNWIISCVRAGVRTGGIFLKFLIDWKHFFFPILFFPSSKCVFLVSYLYSLSWASLTLCVVDLRLPTLTAATAKQKPPEEGFLGLEREDVD